MSDEISNVVSSLPQGYQVPTIQNLPPGATKYQQLLALIEEIGRDVRPSYTLNKVCAERLKRSLVNARIVVRECMVEADNDRKKANETAAKVLAQQPSSSSANKSTTSSTSK